MSLYSSQLVHIHEMKIEAQAEDADTEMGDNQNRKEEKNRQKSWMQVSRQACLATRGGEKGSKEKRRNRKDKTSCVKSRREKRVLKMNGSRMWTYANLYQPSR